MQNKRELPAEWYRAVSSTYLIKSVAIHISLTISSCKKLDYYYTPVSRRQVTKGGWNNWRDIAEEERHGYRLTGDSHVIGLTKESTELSGVFELDPNFGFVQETKRGPGKGKGQGSWLIW